MPTGESERIRRIFDEVADLPPGEQVARIDQLCGDDPELRLRVQELVNASNHASHPGTSYSLPAFIEKFRAAAEEEPLDGQTIGHFRILRLIGQGGMGRVYLGVDRRLSREVAIKFMPTGIANRSDLVELFRTEAQIASGLKHTNIVTIYDVGEAEGYHFIVMELIKGRTLRERLLEQGTFDTEEICQLSVHILSALQRAHAAGIIHCDIKPENVMFDEENTGDGYSIKVLDFGLARFGIAINQQGAPLLRGTPEYASPEQRAGAPVDARSDIYSFGVMLHEMVYGCRPGAAASIAPGAPMGLVSIIRGCIAEAPDERYQSVSELLDHFHSLNDHRLSRLGLTWLTQILSQREGLAVIVVALLTLFAVAVPILTKSAPSKAGEIRQPPNVRPHNWAYVSQNGDHIVYDQETDSRQSVWVLDQRSDSHRQIIEPQEYTYRWPTISNDSRYVYLIQRGDGGRGTPNVLIRVSLFGGPVEKIAIGVDSPIGFSPDGKRYAYVDEDVKIGTSQLKIGTLGREDSVVLSARYFPDSFTVDGPAWSPDGQTIATTFCSTRGGVYFDVVGVDVNTGQVQSLTGQKWGHVLGIDWLPDNSGLVVNGKERGSDLVHDLYLVQPGALSRQQIYNPNNSYDYRGRPSIDRESGEILGVYGGIDTSFWFNSAGVPDVFRLYDTGYNMDGYEGVSWLGSDRLVFTSRLNGSEHLWVTDLDGSNRQITKTGKTNRYPDTSPDGRYIVFSSDRQGPTNINRIDVDGGNQIKLSNGLNDTDPQISPDGKWVVFTSENRSLRTLWRVSIDGGKAVQLTTRWAESPSISPDGRWIACIAENEMNTKSGPSLAIIPFEGGEPVTFVDLKSRGNSRYYRYFRWSPDGTGIDYIVVKNRVANIWRHPLSGGEPKQITFFDSLGIDSFRWSADGKRLVVTRSDNALRMNLINWETALPQSMLAPVRLINQWVDQLYPPLSPSPVGTALLIGGVTASSQKLRR